MTIVSHTYVGACCSPHSLPNPNVLPLQPPVMCAVCMAAPVCGTSCVALNPSYHSWIPASGSNAIQRSAKRTVAQRRQLVAVANCSQQSSTSMAQGSLGLGTAEDSPQSVTHATLVSLMPDARDQAHTMQAAFGSSQHQLDGTQAICMVANLKALSDGGFSKADVRSVLICCPQILTAAVQVQPWLTFLKAYGELCTPCVTPAYNCNCCSCSM